MMMTLMMMTTRCPEGSSASELSSYDECIEKALKGRGQKLHVIIIILIIIVIIIVIITFTASVTLILIILTATTVISHCFRIIPILLIPK